MLVIVRDRRLLHTMKDPLCCWGALLLSLLESKLRISSGVYEIARLDAASERVERLRKLGWLFEGEEMGVV